MFAPISPLDELLAPGDLLGDGTYSSFQIPGVFTHPPDRPLLKRPRLEDAPAKAPNPVRAGEVGVNPDPMHRMAVSLLQVPAVGVVPLHHQEIPIEMLHAPSIETPTEKKITGGSLDAEARSRNRDRTPQDS